MSARNRELFGLIPAALLVTAGFAGVFIQRQQVLSNVSLTYGAIFLGLCLAGHIFIRVTLPNADPYMFPLVALLASFGIVMVYRISATDARQQAQWFVLGLVLFAVTIIAFRDYRKLEQYRYVIVAVSLVLLVLPRLPGIGEQVNGAYLGIKVPGGLSFQPTEFSKIGLVIFLASYLRDTRQVMVLGARRVLGVTLPPIKHFGPVLVIWGVAMVMLVLLSDIGSSLMFYGALLAMLYVATGRLSFVVIGLLAFALGAWYLGTHIPHVHARFEDWQHPFNSHLYNATGGSYQVANGIFAQAGGGLVRAGLGPVDPHRCIPCPADRHDLRGHHQRAGAVRRHGDAGHLPAVHLPRLQDRDPGPRLVLEPAGDRSVGGVRAPGVRDRRRGDPGDPAHRRHAAVHLLRRRLDRRQLRAAGAAAAGLRPPAEAVRREPPDHEAVRLHRRPVRAADRLDDPLDGVRRHGAQQQPAQQPDADHRAEDQARADPRRRRRDAGAIGAGRRRPGTGCAPTRWARCSPSRSATPTSSAGNAAGLEKSPPDDCKGLRRRAELGVRPAGRQPDSRRRRLHDLDPKAQQVARQELAGRAGSVVALDPRTGAVLAMYSNPTYDDNHPQRALLGDAAASSTAPRRASIRRARPSRS